MKIYGLSGKSGTGKSYHASQLCGRMGIDGIIDDGLFVYNNSIVAGVSAKKQSSQIRAIKTAIFTDEEHRAQVSSAIRSKDPNSILVLGTSDEMIELIIKRLGLPEAEEIIRIEDITSPQERETALKRRSEEGMHVIPAPTFAVKKQFSGYFVDPMKSFRKAEEEAEAEAAYMGDTPPAEKTMAGGTQKEQSILRKLEEKERSQEELLEEGSSVRELLETLTLMELKGLIHRTEGLLWAVGSE